MTFFRAITVVFLVSAGLSSGFARAAHADSSLGELRKWVRYAHSEVPQAALDEALNYYKNNASIVTNKKYITIIDFDQPSSDYRMHVIEMASGNVTSYLVAHGKNTGDLYAENFSNTEGSLMSSLGIYLTGAPYIGEHGLSMRLLGEEKTNSNAFTRDIVMHGASYVSEDFVKANGRLGRSDGCTAVETQFSTPLVNQLNSGSVYLIYKSNSSGS